MTLFITTLLTQRASARQHQQHNLARDSCMVPSDRQDQSFINQHSLMPWSNGLASSRKLKTWVYLRLRLARPCLHLRCLAMTCDHFGRDQICTQVNASLLSFGHPTQVSSQVQLAPTCNYLRARGPKTTNASNYQAIRNPKY